MKTIKLSQAVEILKAFSDTNMPMNQVRQRQYLAQFEVLEDVPDKRETFYYNFGLNTLTTSGDIQFAIDFTEPVGRRIRISWSATQYSVSKATALMSVFTQVTAFAAKIDALFEDYTITKE